MNKRVLIIIVVLFCGFFFSCAGTSSNHDISSSPRQKLYTGKDSAYGLWVNTNKWRKVNFPPKNIDFRFVHKSSSYIGFVIAYTSDRISLNTSKKNLIENMRAKFNDMKIVFEENRQINGNDVLCLTFSGHIKKTPITALIWQYSGNSGAVHITALAHDNLFDKYYDDISIIVDGLVTPPFSEVSPLVHSIESGNSEGRNTYTEKRLIELNELYQKGLINEEEYKKKKAEILDQL